jgi:DNA-binding response OmpR family regulator
MLAARDLAGWATRTVVLAMPHSAFTDAAADRLRRAGWRVYRATDCGGLRRLAWRALPEVVVLPADGFDESGWLTCAKLLRASPRLRVILVGPAGEQAYARFVGAEALLPADATADDLADCVEGSLLQVG